MKTQHVTRIMYLWFVLGLSITMVRGQNIPQAINYQAVARNSSGEPLASKDLTVRISIMTAEPSIKYVESHEVITNELGIFDLIIGSGLPSSGLLSDVRWGEFRHFIQIEVSLDGSSYQIIGNSELLSVPYAFYALEAANASSASNSDSLLWKKTGSDIYYNEGNVGIGLDNPTYQFSVLSTIEVIGSNGVSAALLRDNPGNGGSLSLLDSEGFEKLAMYINSAREGSITGYNAEGRDVNIITALADGQGFMRVNGPNGNNNITATSLLGEPNNGWLGVGDENGDARAQIYVRSNGDGSLLLRNTEDNISHWGGSFETGGGWLSVYGGNGTRNIRLTSLLSDDNRGYLQILDEEDKDKVNLYINSSGNGRLDIKNNSSQIISTVTTSTSGAGFIETSGPNGNENVRMTSLSSNANHGYLGVYDASGNAKAGAYVDGNGQGVIFGDVKNFIAPNPFDPETEIIYASLEGPEAAAYLRGQAILRNGECEVFLPDHFQAVAAKDLTIQLTPTSADSKGLAVISRSFSSFKVKELFQGSGNYNFDWEVKAVRKGFEQYQVIRSKQERQALSSGLNQTTQPEETSQDFNPNTSPDRLSESAPEVQKRH